MSAFEFRSPFDLLVSTTDEYSKLLPLFEESVLPQLSNTNALLDVGAGPGLITLPLSTHFDQIGIVEPDPVFCLEAVKKVLPTGKPVTAYNGPWPSTQFGRQQYDLIVCAHVLYFIEPQEWDSFIQRTVPYLAPGGKFAIVLVAKGDDASELIRRSLDIEEPGSYPFSAAAIESIQAGGHTFDVLSFEANIVAGSAEEILNVLPLFPIMQYDKSSTQQQRRTLVEEHFAIEEGYRLPYGVDVIIVEAP